MRVLVPILVIFFYLSANLFSSDQDDVPFTGEDIKYGKEISIQDHFREGVMYLMAPLMVPLKVVGRRNQGQTLPEALENTAKEDSKYLVGYAIIVYGLVKSVRCFLK